MLRFLRKALVVTADEVEIKVIIPNQLGVFDVFDDFRAFFFLQLHRYYVILYICQLIMIMII